MIKPSTVGELRQSGYSPRSVKKEMRHNLIRKLERGERVFPGIVGYEETVVPQIENAILSGQDIDLPRRARPGQDAARALAGRPPRRGGAGARRLRDQRRPARSRSARPAARRVAEQGDQAPIEWLPRDRRYGEKLATPDITIADLIGEVDPDQGRRGPLPLRRADDPLRPAAAHQPRHLRHQRAARPRRAHPGRPAQHHGRARRPDPRLQGAPAARPLRGRDAPTPRTTPTAGASSRRSRTASARRSAPTTRARSATRSPSWSRSAPRFAADGYRDRGARST